MKNEVKPGIIIAIVAVLVVAIGGFYFVAGGGGGGNQGKLDIKKIDPALLRDAPPPRRGDPGYRERTTD
jgi:hypothetical protein